MRAEPIRVSANAETWKITEDTRTHYVRIKFDEDADAVIVVFADHKGPWIGDGTPYDSFEAARRAFGLPEPV